MIDEKKIKAPESVGNGFAPILRQKQLVAALGQDEAESERTCGNDVKAYDQGESELMFPQANEQILKNTKLMQVQPAPDLPEFEQPVVLTQSGADGAGTAAPWEGVELQKVFLNKYINLGYLSENSLKLTIERLRNMQTERQKNFKRIITEMQRDRNENKSNEYSSRIFESPNGRNFNILFLDFSCYLKSLIHFPTRRILQVADLVYPQGLLMQWAFRTLSFRQAEARPHENLRESGENQSEEQKRESGKAKPVYAFQTKFDFTVSLLSSLDEYHGSIFLIGGTASLLNRVEEIFKISFGNIKIVGRYTTRYRKSKRIAEVRTVINKSAPTLLLVAKNTNIHDFVDDKNTERKITSFIVLDYPEALLNFSGRYRRKKLALIRILSFLGHLILPWNWPRLLCMLIFVLKICCMTLVGNTK